MAAFACGVVCARLWAWSLSVLAVTVLSDDSLSSFFNVVYFNMVMSTTSMCVCVCVSIQAGYVAIFPRKQCKLANVRSLIV